MIYANQPYVETVSGCDAGAPSERATPGDAAMNVVSHEHNETITDEIGNAWYDILGYENGDKCAWIVGTQTRQRRRRQYNQTINGHHYDAAARVLERRLRLRA